MLSDRGGPQKTDRVVLFQFVGRLLLHLPKCMCKNSTRVRCHKRSSLKDSEAFCNHTFISLTIKDPMSWPFLLIIIPLLRYTKIDLYCAIFQTHIGFSYSISVKYVYSLSVLNGLLELAPPPCEPSVL